MSIPIDDWNGKPINKDTATSDMVSSYAHINNVNIWHTQPYRNQGVYLWDLCLDDGPRVTMQVSHTRARTLDGSLIEWIQLHEPPQ